MSTKKAIVIGAGIVGLAHARALALQGYAVTVFERHPHAIGASIRNFGMVWPLGQPSGTLYNRAMRSRSIWKEICVDAGLWHAEVGSLHVATQPLEAIVLQEIAQSYAQDRGTQYLSPAELSQKSQAINTQNALGALWSPTEVIIESRKAIQALPQYFTEKWGIVFHHNTAITSIEENTVFSGNRSWQADLIVVCSGPDFETLYPEVFNRMGITKCKLQMMRLVEQPGQWQLGAALCGGLSLIHYKGFEVAPSLPQLKSHFKETMPEYLHWGIHVMACQNGDGAITVGDTHEYGLHHDPFDKAYLNNLVMNYLKSFAHFPDWQVLQTWNGIYPKMVEGHTEYVEKLSNHVWVVNGLGGAGMTLSFGLAEEVMALIQ